MILVAKSKMLQGTTAPLTPVCLFVLPDFATALYQEIHLLQRLLISANMSLQKKSSNLGGHLSANVLDILRNAFLLRSFHL